LIFNSGKQAIAISRFVQEDGYADSSFGTNARTVTEYEGGNSYCNSIAIQPNGKIVAGVAILAQIKLRH